MTARDLPEPEVETLDELAAGWFARRRSGDITADEAAQFEAWLAEEDDHLEAYERLERSWGGVESARGDPRIMIMRERALQNGRAPRRAFARRAIAASLAAVFAAGLLLAVQMSPSGGHGSLSDQSFSTGVGQQATVTLSDGSVVTLNTGTRLRTRAAKGRRLVELEQGQAYFRVAKDPLHPFIVSAGGRTVTAVGTAFDVRLDAKTFAVTVVEGKVRVERAPPPALQRALSEAPPKAEAAVMTAGSQLVALAAPDTGPGKPMWTVVEADPARAVSWLRGYVAFQRAPFGEVAAEMNRYSERKIVVDDPELAKTPISGAFKAGDIDAFVAAFEAYRVARVESDTADTVRLGRFN